MGRTHQALTREDVMLLNFNDLIERPSPFDRFDVFHVPLDQPKYHSFISFQHQRHTFLSLYVLMGILALLVPRIIYHNFKSWRNLTYKERRNQDKFMKINILFFHKNKTAWLHFHILALLFFLSFFFLLNVPFSFFFFFFLSDPHTFS